MKAVLVLDGPKLNLPGKRQPANYGRETTCGIVINTGAITHISVAVLTSLNTCESAVIGAHVGPVHGREAFRHPSPVSLRADSVIAGQGLKGYAASVRRICHLAERPPP